MSGHNPIATTQGREDNGRSPRTNNANVDEEQLAMVTVQVVSDHLSLSMGRENAALILRSLEAEFDRLANGGRDTRTDPELIALGVYCETISRWLDDPATSE